MVRSFRAHLTSQASKRDRWMAWTAESNADQVVLGSRGGVTVRELKNGCSIAFRSPWPIRNNINSELLP